jgi:hypothetical protein
MAKFSKRRFAWVAFGLLTGIGYIDGLFVTEVKTKEYKEKGHTV